MPDREARAGPSTTTHEEEPRPAGRRRRQVADWGVGEELFDGMPGRRFDRRGDDHRIPRGGADDGRRTIVITESEPVERRSRSPTRSSRAARTRCAPARSTTRCGEATSRSPARPRVRRAAAGRGGGLASRARTEGHRPADGVVRGGVEGRRTVKIGGRPAEFHSSPARRRPARTVHERVGPRPDRIAAWACALGLLLILIAIATANI